MGSRIIFLVFFSSVFFNEIEIQRFSMLIMFFRKQQKTKQNKDGSIYLKKPTGVMPEQACFSSRSFDHQEREEKQKHLLFRSYAHGQKVRQRS